MTLYIVRWPHLQASLIEAEDDEELVHKLDEVGDPGGCEWALYKGQVWIDFDLPVEITVDRKDKNRPITANDLEIDTSALRNEPWRLDLSAAQAESGSEMKDAVRQFAFPALNNVIDAMEEENVDAEALTAALDEDLKPLLEYEWRLAHVARRDDPVSHIMQELGITVPLPYMKQGEDGEH